jgi:hypothetical protein
MESTRTGEHIVMDREAEAATIQAKYRVVDGCHVFTSEDVGLYVAHMDAKEAFDSVPAILQELITMKTKRPCEVEPIMTFGEFMESIKARKVPASTPVLGNAGFIVRRAP